MTAVRLRQWRWKQLPVYNGFTHDERVRIWQLVTWMIETGRKPKASVCCISGATARVGYHSENYYDCNPYPLAQPIHFVLHRRFDRPAAWAAIIERHAVTGKEWFANQSPTPIDLAAQLRAEHGDDIADVLARALSSGVEARAG